MEEERFNCIKPMHAPCPYYNQQRMQPSYPYPGIPFGFENIFDEDELDEKEQSPENQRTGDTGETEEKEERAPSPNVDEILYSIEKNNPYLMRRLLAYRIPYVEAKKILREIIRLTLAYSKK